MAGRVPSLALPSLPITAHLESIITGIRDNPISIIQSSPGSGKTTVVPLALYRQEWLHNRKILVLQPRRLVTKSVAMRMSELLHEELGKTVGYQIRLESMRSPSTRIEVITEGLLTRRILSDPSLTDVGVIIFDEFHERNINADLAFALAREVNSILRPDLRLVIMSATLQALRAHPQFADVWAYSFDSTVHPVEVVYSPAQPRTSLWDEAARVTRGALRQYEGDILVFLPGSFEIERCREALVRSVSDIVVLPLYGDLPYAVQQRALSRRSSDPRRIVLSTPIAETSLTIEGIRIVIDSGLHKVARSDTTGSTDLSTERISLDSADQRAGRAGRTSPGVCIRMWSQSEHATLRPAREPEILRSDLTQNLLELYSWGVRSPSSFAWITPPPKQALSNGVQTLEGIGAITSEGSITELGKQLVYLGAHPRFGRMCVESKRYGLETTAAALLTLLEERPSQARSREATDIQILVDAIVDSKDRTPSPSRQLFSRWLKRINDLPKPGVHAVWPHAQHDATGYLLAVAFPERTARQRSLRSERYLLSSGKGAALRERDPLVACEFLVVAMLHERSDDSQIGLAARLNPLLFDTVLADRVTTRLVSHFDEERGVLIASHAHRVGAVTLREEPIHDSSPEVRIAALTAYLRTSDGHNRLPFSSKARSIRERTEWVRTRYPDVQLPDLSDDALMRSEPFWLASCLPASGKLAAISEKDVEAGLRNRFSYATYKHLESVAPEAMTLPSGKIRYIDYAGEDAPALQAMIQELFGLRDTPTIGQYQHPLTLRLLSPARRPMQITKDLASFWRTGYPQVRRELRGRYPKHRWPENPLNPDTE